MGNEPLIDLTINSDLVLTREKDDVQAPQVARIQTMSLNMDGINRYHGNYNISKRTQPVRYIVVHYTGAGNSKPGCARNNCIYFSNGNRNASAHYFIDDGGIWEYADPDAHYTWHCGDGHGQYGITNSNSVGIEVCQDGDYPFTPTEISYLTKLVRALMSKYNVPAERVVRHYDASRKQCPYHYAGTGIRQQRWEELRSIITGGGEEIVTPQDKQDIANLVVNYDLNGVLLRDRIIGTDIASNEARAEVLRTDDPTGRGNISTTHEHVKWIGKSISEINEKLDSLNQSISSLADAVQTLSAK